VCLVLASAEYSQRKSNETFKHLSQKDLFWLDALPDGSASAVKIHYT